MIHGIYRMTPRQFRKAIDAGVFGENHVELLGGIPFIMSENPPHILASPRFIPRCSPWRPRPRWFVNKEHRLALGQWRPLADVVVLRGPDTTYGTRLARGRRRRAPGRGRRHVLRQGQRAEAAAVCDASASRSTGSLT